LGFPSRAYKNAKQKEPTFSPDEVYDISHYTRVLLEVFKELGIENHFADKFCALQAQSHPTQRSKTCCAAQNSAARQTGSGRAFNPTPKARKQCLQDV